MSLVARILRVRRPGAVHQAEPSHRAERDASSIAGPLSDEADEIVFHRKEYVGTTNILVTKWLLILDPSQVHTDSAKLIHSEIALLVHIPTWFRYVVSERVSNLIG